MQTHQVQWTQEKEREFWEYWADKNNESYFTRDFGADIVNHAQKYINLNTSVFDYASGSCELYPFLKPYVQSYTGYDTSQSALSKAKQNYIGEHFRVLHDVPAEKFGGVFCIEVLEHLSDESLKKVLADIYGHILHDGFLIITVPNKENLEKNNVRCPDCGAVFHRMQHVRSWDTKSLERTMEQAGFKSIACYETLFRMPGIRSRLANIYDYFIGSPHRKRNLIFIGKK